jgi:hypothetical protein
MKIDDTVQFVQRSNKKTCKIALELVALSIPVQLYHSSGVIKKFGKRYKFFTDKSIALVSFKIRQQTFSIWVPIFLIEHFKRIPNHPLTQIFL